MKKIISRKLNKSKKRKNKKQKAGNKDIPIVIISWNSLTFTKKFIEQMKKFSNPIIVLDNKSTFQPLLDYYKEIKEKLKDRIDIRLLDQNYGHEVYKILADKLPKIYLLSDPDIEINKNMPKNFVEIMLNLSEKYKSNRVGLALNITDKDIIQKCSNQNPTSQNPSSVIEGEKKYWTNPIKDDKDYELYWAEVDTTFCLINTNYNGNHIRIAGDFTAKHLPFYNNWIKNNFTKEELEFWLKDNKSTSIIRFCLTNLNK